MEKIIENEYIEEDNQLAENTLIETYEDSINEYDEKRQKLKNTKITKQTWSVLEIYQKIKDELLILEPEYQRKVVWDSQKQTSFIESLFMGIVVPPIYIVEIPGNNVLDDTTYEVVDGKQRLSAIKKFLLGDLKLNSKSLEYYADWYGGKNFNEINESYEIEVKNFISQVLDIYVITANSPEFTKYDIFSRLNKGSVQLTVNEIRRAIYRSDILDKIDEFIKNNQNTTQYDKIFSLNDKKRYYDYGRFFESIASYINTNVAEGIMEDYKSRPREMINNILESFQKKIITLDTSKLNKILNDTYLLLYYFNEETNPQYYINTIIRLYVDSELSNEDKQSILEVIKKDQEIKDTLIKSPSTTSNVNKRIKRAIKIFEDYRKNE